MKPRSGTPPARAVSWTATLETQRPGLAHHAAAVFGVRRDRDQIEPRPRQPVHAPLAARRDHFVREARDAPPGEIEHLDREPCAGPRQLPCDARPLTGANPARAEIEAGVWRRAAEWRLERRARGIAVHAPTRGPEFERRASRDPARGIRHAIARRAGAPPNHDSVRDPIRVVGVVERIPRRDFDHPRGIERRMTREQRKPILGEDRETVVWNPWCIRRRGAQVAAGIREREVGEPDAFGIARLDLHPFPLTGGGGLETEGRGIEWIETAILERGAEPRGCARAGLLRIDRE